MTNKKTAQKSLPSYRNTFSCVTTQASLQSPRARGMLPWWKRHYLVVEQVWAIWWISVDEDIARNHSLINNDHTLCTTGLATVLITVLMGLDWSFWLTWMYGMIKLNGICAWIGTLCFLHQCVIGSHKKRTLDGLFPSRSRARLSRGICDPGQTYLHTVHGSARFSSLLQCKGWCCPWCWNSLLNPKVTPHLHPSALHFLFTILFWVFFLYKNEPLCRALQNPHWNKNKRLCLQLTLLNIHWLYYSINYYC